MYNEPSLFIGISLLHHRHRSPIEQIPLPESFKSAEYYSSISEKSNTKRIQLNDYYNSTQTAIMDREFEER